jgi:hypothetical protein
MASIFGAIFLRAAHSAGWSFAAAQHRAPLVACDELLTPGVPKRLAARHIVTQNFSWYDGAAPHNDIRGKIDLACWNMIYHNRKM